MKLLRDVVVHLSQLLPISGMLFASLLASPQSFAAPTEAVHADTAVLELISMEKRFSDLPSNHEPEIGKPGLETSYVGGLLNISASGIADGRCIRDFTLVVKREQKVAYSHEMRGRKAIPLPNALVTVRYSFLVFQGGPVKVVLRFRDCVQDVEYVKESEFEVLPPEGSIGVSNQ